MTGTEQKKGRYSDAQRRATNKYRAEHAKIELIITQEEKERIKQAAADAGQSVTRFILSKVLGD